MIFFSVFKKMSSPVITNRSGLNPADEVSKMTTPVMSDKEKSVIISKRHHQIDDPEHSSTVPETELKALGLFSSYDIAMYEFEKNIIPYYEIIRMYPNGKYEVWTHKDFKLFPD